MPRLTDDMESRQIGGSTFSFSARKIDDLEADKYSLGTVVVDVTGSVYGLEDSIEGALKVIVETCRKNPLADNMMLRVVLFSSSIPGHLHEVHGFKPLPDIAPDDYTGIITPGGATPLRDAAYASIQATVDYGTDLMKNGFLANGITFVITDGEDNISSVGPNTLKAAVQEAVKGEGLESFRPVLVGLKVKPNSTLNGYLTSFRDECGFDQFVAVEDANVKSLAKLADWISQSFSSQSQSLGSGGASQSLAF